MHSRFNVSLHPQLPLKRDVKALILVSLLQVLRHVACNLMDYFTGRHLGTNPVKPASVGICSFKLYHSDWNQKCTRRLVMHACTHPLFAIPYIITPVSYVYNMQSTLLEVYVFYSV